MWKAVDSAAKYWADQSQALPNEERPDPSDEAFINEGIGMTIMSYLDPYNLPENVQNTLLGKFVQMVESGERFNIGAMSQEICNVSPSSEPGMNPEDAGDNPPPTPPSDANGDEDNEDDGDAGEMTPIEAPPEPTPGPPAPAAPELPEGDVPTDNGSPEPELTPSEPELPSQENLMAEPTPAAVSEVEKELKPKKRGPGRPPGSKNKPKTDEPVEKRPPGRPPGSKDTKPRKTKSRGRGRPPGSKNKPKVVEEEIQTEPTISNEQPAGKEDLKSRLQNAVSGGNKDAAILMDLILKQGYLKDYNLSKRSSK